MIPLTDAARIKAALDPVRGLTLPGDSADGDSLDIPPPPPRVLTPPLGVCGLGVEGESTCDPPRSPFCRLVIRYLTPLWNRLSTVPPLSVSSYSIWSILLQPGRSRKNFFPRKKYISEDFVVEDVVLVEVGKLSFRLPLVTGAVVVAAALDLPGEGKNYCEY